MECLNQATEIECSKELIKNEKIVYKNITKHVQWYILVKTYIMNWKWGSLYQCFLSCLTTLSQKVILIAIFLFLTTIASHCRQNQFQQDFQNCRLFPQHSIVNDFIYGESDLLHADLIKSDLSFVVYYAPWDHDSNQFKTIFYKEAVHFHEQINFASINCWYPEGKCKKTEGLMRYPVVILHARLPSNKRAISIQYTGPLLQSHVHRFLNRALKPITYIASQADLNELQLLYQVVVLGCFNNEVPSDFYNFYYASLLLLHFPYMTDVSYAATYNLHLCGGRSHIKLLSMNRTVNYPTRALYQTKSIVHFVQKNIYLMPQWVPVHEYRSEAISNLAASGPLLVAFIPDNPYRPVNDEYLTLRSVVLEYMNCKDNPKVHYQIEKLNRFAAKKLASVNELCLKFSEDSELYSPQNDFIYTDSLCENSLRNSSDQCNMYGSTEYCLLDEEFWFAKDGLAGISLMRNFEYYYRSSLLTTKHNDSDHSSCKEYMQTPLPVGPLNDEYVALAKKWYMEEQCKKYPRSNTSLIRKPEGSRRNISGLSCSSNKTLSFVALDSVQKSDFISSNEKSPNVWIIDSDAQEYYYMQETYSRDSLVNFIYNYTHRILHRKPIATNTLVSAVSTDDIKILELNAENYLNVTQEMGKSFVVLHYGAYCGACKAIGSVLLACSNLFQNIPEVTFARIDVSKNSLPWHLTFTRVPQIIFHPSRKKAESEVFDASREIDLPSLLLFLLSKFDPKTRLKLACNHRGMPC